MADIHSTFQYSTPAHRSGSSLDGMWLFLATEVLFFGALFLAWTVSRHYHAAGFAEAARHTEISLGTINTVLLVTSSLAYAAGLAFIEQGDTRRLLQCLSLTGLLGIAFVCLKLLEWHDDFYEHLFPGSGFALHGPDPGGAQIFFSFYFVGTGLHILHMLAGLGLLAWVILRAWRGAFSSRSHLAVEAVGLYWSFVDVVWLVLYPLIYVVGRPG
ncbi:MAG: cytochrome c oxidase subunit 3 [Acidisphaera sp.]|nr:cytochrome c oxidase subunit 3 [Acidisphaera sp.]